MRSYASDMTSMVEPNAPHPHDHLFTPAALRLLVEVDALGGVGAAARALGISQPTASRTLAAVEHHVGFPLFTRTPRGSAVTQAGIAVVAQARVILEAHEKLGRTVETLAAGEAGTLKLAASRTIGEHLVPSWLGAEASAHPDVWVSFRFDNSAVVIRWVKEGTVPLGFIEDPVPPEGLASEVLSHDQLAIIAPLAHPWAHQRVNADDLAAVGLVEREPGSGTRATLDRVLPERAHPAVELDSNAAIVRAVAAGVGPAVLSEMAVKRHVHDGAVARVQWEGPALERPLHAIWRADARVPREVVDFLNVVRECCGKA